VDQTCPHCRIEAEAAATSHLGRESRRPIRESGDLHPADAGDSQSKVGVI
jgi:hypothetical protein